MATYHELLPRRFNDVIGHMGPVPLREPVGNGDYSGTFGETQYWTCQVCRVSVPIGQPHTCFTYSPRPAGISDILETVRLLTPQPQPWECPRCHAINAPTAMQCTCRPEDGT